MKASPLEHIRKLQKYLNAMIEVANPASVCVYFLPYRLSPKQAPNI
jgi:hypothetical protein